MPDDLADLVIVVVISFVILALGIGMISPIIQTTTDNANGEQIQTHQKISQAGVWNTIDSTTGTDPTALTSRGYSVNLTGANDSYVKSDQEIEFATNNNWTISLWARLDNTTQETEHTALSLDGRVIVTYNKTTSNWTGWYYDDGSTDSYSVNVSDASQPANFSNIQIRANNTSLSIYRNNTLGETVDLNSSNSVSAPVNSTNWNGRLEEVRTFDDALNTSTRQEIVDSPVSPQTKTNRTTRIMFDEPYRDTQLVLFSPASLTQSNVTFSNGFDGSELSENTDYNWNTNGPRLKLFETSTYSNVPVLYVDYTSQTLGPHTILNSFVSALVLAMLLPILLILGWMIATMQSTR